MERRDIARAVGRFVENKILDVDVSDALIVATVLGTGILLKDKVKEIIASPRVPHAFISAFDKSQQRNLKKPQ